MVLAEFKYIRVINCELSQSENVAKAKERGARARQAGPCDCYKYTHECGSGTALTVPVPVPYLHVNKEPTTRTSPVHHRLEVARRTIKCFKVLKLKDDGTKSDLTTAKCLKISLVYM